MLKVLSSLVFPLISYTYVTHILQVESIGRVEFARSFTSYFTMLAMLGIVSYATRESAKIKTNKIELTRFAHEIILFNVLAVILSLLLFFCFIFFLPQLSTYKLLLFINSFSIILVALGLEWLFAAMEDYAYISVRSIIIQIISVIIILIFVRTKQDLYLYAFFQMLSLVAPNVINLVYSRKYISWKPVGNYNLKRHIKPILILFLMTVSVQIFSSLDTTMLGFMSGDISVGLYTASTKMINITSSLLVAIISVLTPKISVLVKKQEWNRIKEISYQAISIILMLSIPAALGLALLSKDLIVVFSGKSFIDGNFSAKILALRIILSPLNTYFIVQLFISMGYEKKNLLTTSVAALVNIILNFLLIPSFMQNGAAVATIMAELIELAFNLYFVRNILNVKKIAFNMFQYSLKSLVIILIYWLFSIFLSGFMLIITVIPASAGVYIIILFLLKDEQLSKLDAIR